MSKNLIVTVIVGNTGKSYGRYTFAYLKEYASRIGSDLQIINESQVPEDVYPMLGKLCIKDYLNTYERVAYIDADIVVSPKCVASIFEEVPDTHIGLLVDLTGSDVVTRLRSRLNVLMQLWPTLSYEKQLNFIYRHMNAGVIIVSNKHTLLFDIELKDANKIRQEVVNAAGFCTDQELFNYRILYQSHSVYPLGPHWNSMPHTWNYMNRFNAYFAHYGGVIAKQILPFDMAVWESMK